MYAVMTTLLPLPYTMCNRRPVSVFVSFEAVTLYTFHVIKKTNQCTDMVLFPHMFLLFICTLIPSCHISIVIETPL